MTIGLIWAALGTMFTFACTALGALAVFLFKKNSETISALTMGFAAGIMIAASVWSLLMPALEQAEANQSVIPAWLLVVGGFLIGGGFMALLHQILPHLTGFGGTPEGLPSNWRRSTLLFSAVTLHNIPEGMSVGLLFALAAQQPENHALFSMAVSLAIGIGIQNIPEGTAVALPLAKAGMHPVKAFGMGALSGLAEPLFGILVVLLVGIIEPYMPIFLSFAAGAMIFVVAQEIIPESHIGENGLIGTFGVIIGFALMMSLDVVLG
ncbi:MAG: ZIP family metal transporter [Eggerthellaceae bacterium]|nr:ZIP family metal transporter [Eggerthellaceae bacterium]